MTVRVPAGLDFRDISINEQENGELEDIVVPELIWTYLVHNGYEQAAASFQKSWSSHKSDEKPTVSASFKSIKHRKLLTELIESGKIQEAILLVQKEFPLLKDNKGTTSIEFFKLLCQHFVELIRDRKPNEALEFAEIHLAPLATNNSSFAMELQNVIVLLAYSNPEESNVRHIMSQDSRTALAHTINSAILGESTSKLEKNLKQIAVVCELWSHFNDNADPSVAVKI